MTRLKRLQTDVSRLVRDGFAASLVTPIQRGENFSGIHAMHDALRADACDLVMPDVQRIGGVTGWLKAAALADAAGMPMSSHFFPEISAHLLAAAPTAHWLEFIDWASPILAEPLVPRAGAVRPLPGHGAGLCWDEAILRRYQA